MALSAEPHVHAVSERRTGLWRRLRRTAAAVLQEFLCRRARFGARLQAVLPRSARHQRRPDRRRPKDRRQRRDLVPDARRGAGPIAAPRRVRRRRSSLRRGRDARFFRATLLGGSRAGLALALRPVAPVGGPAVERQAEGPDTEVTIHLWHRLLVGMIFSDSAPLFLRALTLALTRVCPGLPMRRARSVS